MADPTFTVIRDVSESLKSFLQAEVSELSASDAVVFESPAELTAGASPKLSLFLYKIRYNKELRNQPNPRRGLNEIQWRPAALDLCYLMTPFSSSAETQYIIIEKIVHAFHNTAVLKDELLQGQLETAGNEEMRIVPDDLSLNEIYSLWQVFPNKEYRLALTYNVTPVFLPSSRIVETTRVTDARTTIVQKD